MYLTQQKEGIQVEKTLAFANQLLEDINERIKLKNEQQWKEKEAARLQLVRDFEERLTVLKHMIAHEEDWKPYLEITIMSVVVNFFEQGFSWSTISILSNFVNFNSEELNRMPDEQRVALCQVLFEVVDSVEMNEHFYRFFHEQCARPTDRLRLVTTGVTPIEISKEKEREVYQLYKTLYTQIIRAHFLEKEPQLDTLQALAAAMFAILSESTTVYHEKISYFFIQPLHARFLDHFFEHEEEVNEAFMTWYQQTNQTFVHEPKKYEFDYLKKMFFVLNPTQQQVLFATFEEKIQIELKRIDRKIQNRNAVDGPMHQRVIKLQQQLQLMDSILQKKN